MILLPGEFVLIVMVIMIFAEGLISYDEGRRNFVFLFFEKLSSHPRKCVKCILSKVL